MYPGLISMVIVTFFCICLIFKTQESKIGFYLANGSMFRFSVVLWVVYIVAVTALFVNLSLVDDTKFATKLMFFLINVIYILPVMVVKVDEI